jgi:hypothetical protein
MAATWRAVTILPTYAATAKSLLKVFNATGSGVVLRVYRVWLLNSQIAAVAGVLAPVSLVRISTVGSGGIAVTPVKHDTSSTALPAQVTAAYGDTTPGTVDATFRRVQVSTDEQLVGTLTSNQLEGFHPINRLWDSGYGDSNVEPIVLREGFGISVYTPGVASAAGIADVIIEFTVI